jgi:hypothetical protein
VRRQEKTERIGWTYPSEGLRAGVADVGRGDVKTMTVPIGGNWDASANALMALPLWISGYSRSHRNRIG